jgi:excisionase family DNA binding protein
MKDIVGRKNLTSKQVARLLGVSEASVKRWADVGLLPSSKTAGGHRRFSPQDLADFRRQNFSQGRTGRVVRLRRHGQEEVAPLDDALPRSMFRMLVGGQPEEAASALISLRLQGHTMARIADAVLCPALREVGDLWHAGELSVAQEHVATRTALSALHALRAAFKMRETAGTRAAVCCSVEEDYHEMSVHLSALTLEGQGWEVVNIGTSMPFYALAEVVARFRPRLVCVASTILNHPDRAAREYGEFSAAVRRVGASVVLGGAGFMAEGVRRRFPADLHAETFTQLEEYAARQLTQDESVAEQASVAHGSRR